MDGGAHRWAVHRPTLEALAQGLAARTPHGPRLAIPDGDVGTILAMPLDQFAREGSLLEVRVPWLDVTLWFVPEERNADALVREDVSRGRVWTATEVMDVMAISERTSEALRTIALAKLTFDGDIAAVIRRSGG